MGNLFQRRYYGDEELKDAGFRDIGSKVEIHKDVNIFGAENISIGNHVRIDAYVSIIATGQVIIGSHVHIGSYSLLSGGAGIEMKDFTGLSQGVMIYSQSDDYSGAKLTNPTVPSEFTGVKAGKVTLEKHVIIGSGSVILPGITIEEGTSVGALSLVTKSLPEWSIFFGAPAKRISSRSRDLLVYEKKLLDQGAKDGQIS